MNTGQMLFAAGALVLIGSLQLGILSSSTRSTSVSLQITADLIAVSAGEALVDEIKRKSFDEKAIGVKIYDEDSLTASWNFGTDGPGEVLSGADTLPYLAAARFDDIDDYQNYTRIVTDSTMGIFTVRSTIFYVSTANYDLQTVSRSWYKKIRVEVSHRNMSAPVVVQSLRVYGRYF